MFSCDICKYDTTVIYNLQKHFTTQKHINMVEYGKLYLSCDHCNQKYTHLSSLCRHQKKCRNNNVNLEIELIKKDIEINKLKSEITIKDYEKKLEIKEMENKHMQQQLINQTNNIQNAKTIINNNVKVSKIEFLNTNFNDVIDINTFIENYKNEYGLTNKQTETLLENYKNGGINSCISSLVYYLKESAIQQYKEIKGKEIAMVDVIFPFILSDKCIRDHFEKNISGNWDKTTAIDNIKKIVGITDDHVYKHHNTYMYLSDSQKKKLVNGVLKASGYEKLTGIIKPDLYKKNEKDDKDIIKDEINE
jgi:hypothetical protein